MVALLGTMTTTATAMGGGMDHPVPGMPDHSRMSDGSVWVNTDIITIMANGEIPQLHFWYTADEDGYYAYSLNFSCTITPPPEILSGSFILKTNHSKRETIKLRGMINPKKN